MSPADEERFKGESVSGRERAAEGVVEFDLAEMFYQLLENFKYIILAAVVCALAGWALFRFLIAPTYSATAELYVTHSTEPSPRLSELQADSYLTSDYQEILKTHDVQEMVIKSLSLPYTASQLRSMLTVVNPGSTRILYVTVRSPDPVEAAAIANEYASAAKRYIVGAIGTEGLSILSAAKVPGAPDGPDAVRVLLMGFGLGAGVAIGVIVLRFLWDNKLRTADDLLRFAGIQTLAVIPEIDRKSIAT